MQTIGSFLDEWASAERAGDTSALAALLTDDFTGIGPLGSSSPRQAGSLVISKALSFMKLAASTRPGSGHTATRP